MTLDHTGLELGSFLTHLVRREEVIASNIANADTPGYRTRDIANPSGFSDLMHGYQAVITEPEELAGRNDGNNVSIDRESRLLAENTLRFNLVAQMLRGEIKSVRSAIEEGKSA
jgi:flagellar basal-body rod protein FlgB